MVREVWLQKKKRNFRLGDPEPSDGKTSDEETARQGKIQLLAPGSAEDGYFLNKELAEDVLGQWLSGHHTADHFEKFVPLKPAQEAGKRHTLLLNATFWKIHAEANVMKTDVGAELESGNVRLLLDGYVGRLVSSKSSIADAVVQAQRQEGYKFTEGTEPVLVALSCFPNVSGAYALLPKAKDPRDCLPKTVLETITRQLDLRSPKNSISHLTPAGLKSVLQKIIRVRPAQVSFIRRGTAREIEAVPAKDMLALTCVLLATHVGSFVPDISSFVSGSQSFFKRLLVTCYEDSYPADLDDNNEEVLLVEQELAAAAIRALVCKETRQWICPTSDLLRFIRLAEASLLSNKALEFDHKSDRIKKKKKFMIQSGDEPSMQGHKLVSAILDSLRSFETDCNMLKDVGYAKKLFFEELPDTTLTKEPGDFFSKCKGNHLLKDACVMPIWHALDQHCTGYLPYYMDDTASVFPKCTVSSAPFKNFFSKVWDYSSSFNPRRKISVDRYETQGEVHAFHHELKWGQMLLWTAMVEGGSFERPLVPNKFVSIKHSLHKDWLFAMIGHVSVKLGSTTYYCTVSSESPVELAVSRKPARGLKEKDLEDVVKENVKKKALEMFQIGVPLASTKYHPPGTRGMFARLAGGTKFVIVKEQNVKKKKTKSARSKQKTSSSTDSQQGNKTWEDLRHVEMKLPVVYTEEKTAELAIVSCSNQGGVENGFKQDLRSMCEAAPMYTLRRFLQLADGYGNTIQLPGIGREGGATTEGLPRQEDVDVFHFLLRITLSCPGALKLDRKFPKKFLVLNHILFWYIRDDIVRETLAEKILAASKQQRARSTSSRSPASFATTARRLSPAKKWTPGVDTLERDALNRTLHQDQLEGVAFLQRRYLQGYRANMLFVSTGSGKTLTLLSYMLELNKANSLPQYVVVAVPRPAVDNILYEVLALFPRVALVNPTKSNLYRSSSSTYTAERLRLVTAAKMLEQGVEKSFLKKTIHIVQHDHLRHRFGPDKSTLADKMMPLVSNMFFAVDEFHELLSADALKTASALQVASGCKELAILSATPSKNSNIKTIMPWLSLLVDFQVTDRNFFFAMNAAFARVVRTGIPRQHITDIVEIQKTDKEYYTLAPPGVGGTNRNFGSPQSVSKLFSIAYGYVTARFVSLTKEIFAEDSFSRVFIVCQNQDHQNQVLRGLLREKVVEDPERLIHVMKGADSIVTLTPELVASGKVADYRVVIGTIRMNTGFTLTTCDVMLTAPYPSNQASRTQMLGRIDRLGSRAKLLRYYTVVAGILVNMRHRQELDENWAAAIADLAT